MLIFENDRYPTRKEKESYIERQDPVVYGAFDKQGYLNEEQLRFFNENGYLVLEGVLQDWVQPILKELPLLKKQLKGHDELILEPDTDVVRSIFSPDKYNDIFYELACSGPLLGSA